MGNRKTKVLTIDDNNDNLVIMKALINDAFPDAVVLTAFSGQQGIEFAIIEEPDVILLDVIMPGMDGFEVCRRLKTENRTCDIPVVFVTAIKADKESRIQALECGAEAFLTKPIDESELTAQIRAMLKIRTAVLERRDEKRRLTSLVEEKSKQIEKSYKKTLHLLETIKESEEKFKYIFDNSLIGKSLTLPSGEIQVNKSMSAMLGYTEKELKNKKWQAITHPDDIEFIERETAEILSGKKESMRLNKRYIKKDGSILWVDLQSSIRRDTDGKPLYFITSIIDITDRMIAQKSLQQSEEKYRLLVTQMTQGIAVHEVILDEEGSVIDYRFIDVNHGFEELTGLKSEDILGKTVMEVLPGTEQYWIEKYGHVAMTGEPLIYENYSRALNKYYDIIAYSPKPKQFATIFTDNTERKQTEEQIKQYNQDLLESQRIAHLGTWRWNLVTNELVWSNELYKMYGYDPKLPPPPYSEHMKLFTPDSWDKLSASIECARTSGISYELELKTVKTDGSNGWIWAQGEAKKDISGNIISLCGAAQDITVRKQAETEIRRQNELFTSLLKLLPVGVFMVDAVNGRPLVANNTALSLLGRGILPDANKHNLSKVYKARRKGNTTPYPTEEMPITLGMHGFSSHVDDMLVERPDGTEVLLEVYGTSINNEQGLPWASLITFLDITERMRIFDELEEALKFNQDIINSANEGIIVYDNELRYKIWNPFMENLSGLSAKKVIGRKPEEVFPWLKKAGVIKNLKSALNGKTLEEIDFYYNVAGTEKSGWARDNSGPLYNRKGEIHGVLGMVQNIDERKKSEDTLLYMSYHDYLTGLYNRRFFEEALNRLDTDENLPISIIMTDVNGLKLVNDSFGHIIGDDFLKKSAEIIRKACRAEDIIARLGGDEFAVILPKTYSVETQQILNAIMNLAAEVKIANVELSISVGYDMKGNHDQSIEEILANAENNMYKHKLNERSSMRSKTIDLIMKTLFEKSNREMLHSKRVSRICEAIAMKMDYDKDEIGQIRIAGLIHDIGKIGIDEKILNKNGKPDNEEWKEIKKHPEMGWRILSSTNEFSELANIVIAHHEKWDGSGYPNGLKGEEIPLKARIITVADSYDAMTSERSYRKPLGKDAAVEELKMCSGTQFDPEIVDVFLNQVLPRNNDFFWGVTPYSLK